MWNNNWRLETLEIIGIIIVLIFWARSCMKDQYIPEPTLNLENIVPMDDEPLPVSMREIPKEKLKLTEGKMYGLCEDKYGKKYAGKIEEILSNGTVRLKDLYDWWYPLDLKIDFNVDSCLVMRERAYVNYLELLHVWLI